MEKPVVRRYLERFTDKFSQGKLRHLAEGLSPYDSAFVVPVFAEPSDCIEHLLESRCSEKRRLVILVINERLTAQAADKQANKEFLKSCLSLKTHQPHQRSSRELTLLQAQGPEPDLLLLNCTAQGGFLEKQGVGLARKLGLDLALCLHEMKLLKSSYFGSSDADARLQSWRFSELEQSEAGYSGLLFDFKHLVQTSSQSADSPQEQAMMQLETAFRYYALGLAHAGSPYCYTALGSALAVEAKAYAQVRGVPNRLAGEDFYLLSKLSQVGPLRRVRGRCVQIISRVSTRVPFGTGQSLLELERKGSMKVMAPAAFEQLRQMIFWGVRRAEGEAELPQQVSQEMQSMHLFYERNSALKPEALAQLPGATQRRRRFFEQFDALKQRQSLSQFEKAAGSSVTLEGALKICGLIHPLEDTLPDGSIDWSKKSLELQTLSMDVLPMSYGATLQANSWNFPALVHNEKK